MESQFSLLVSHENTLRLAFFAGILGVMTFAETLWPRRDRHLPRRIRWPGNITMVILSTLCIRFLFPFAAVGAATLAADAGWGLFHVATLPPAVAFVAGLVLMDLSIWAQHVVMHHVPWLWRLHRLHHSDIDLDTSSALRFHPAEVALSQSYKMVIIALVGVPVEAVIAFEIVLSSAALFNHANVKLPEAVDQMLRLLIVTPDMHRVHHSSKQVETNSNYGFFISWWDRLFGSYVAQPSQGHSDMEVGLESFREASHNRLDQMLAQPLKNSQPPEAS